MIREAGNNETAQLNKLYEVLFAREPNKAEAALLKQFLNSDEKLIEGKASNGKFEVALPTGLTAKTPINPIRAAAFVDLVHTVANSNDFAYRF